MTATIRIGFQPAEGAVLRMIGLVERRGFVVHRIAMEESQGSLELGVRPRDPSRQLPIVAAQLRRLIEVRDVSFSPPAPGAPQ